LKSFLFLLLIFLGFTLAALAKGASGSYFITGTAFGKNNSVLTNAELVVQGKKFKTNDKGQFEIEIHWETACPSNASRKEIRQATRKLNPKFIYISYRTKEIKVRNKWKRFCYKVWEGKNKISIKQDLHFA